MVLSKVIGFFVTEARAASWSLFLGLDRRLPASYNPPEFGAADWVTVR